MASQRQRLNSDERREQIVQAATRVFGAKGTSAGTLQEIADEVGITRAGVLHHFGSKEMLLQAVLEYRDRSDVAELPGQHTPSGADWFRHLVATAEENAHRPGIVQTYAVLSAEAITEGHSATPFFQERFEALRQEGRSALREAFAHHTLDEQRVAFAAACIPAVMDGLQVQWLLDPSSIDLAEATKFCIDAIIRAVVDDTPSPLELSADS